MLMKIWSLAKNRPNCSVHGRKSKSLKKKQLIRIFKKGEEAKKKPSASLNVDEKQGLSEKSRES